MAERENSPPVREDARRTALDNGSVDLLVVGRDRPLLYESFRRLSIGESDIEIIVDRRHRIAGVGAEPERRRLDISEALRTTGWAVIPGSARRPT